MPTTPRIPLNSGFNSMYASIPQPIATMAENYRWEQLPGNWATLNEEFMTLSVQCRPPWGPWRPSAYSSVTAIRTCLLIHCIRSVVRTAHIHRALRATRQQPINSHITAHPMAAQPRVSFSWFPRFPPFLTMIINLTRCHNCRSLGSNTNSISRFWNRYKLLAATSVIFILRTSHVRWELFFCYSRRCSWNWKCF